MSILRNQYPFPVETGGLEGDGQLRSLRNYLGYLRQPDLKQPPNVVSVTGLGTGGGANITSEGSEADQSQGLVRLFVGLNPQPSGVLTLRFPIAPQAGQYRVLAEWAQITPTVSVNNLLLAWSAMRALVPGEELTIAYQWANST